MRLNNESFDAMYCRKENVLTQKMSTKKIYFSVDFCKKMYESPQYFFHLYIYLGTEKLC